jgi:hypothetical protein
VIGFVVFATSVARRKGLRELQKIADLGHVFRISGAAALTIGRLLLGDMNGLSIFDLVAAQFNEDIAIDGASCCSVTARYQNFPSKYTLSMRKTRADISETGALSPLHLALPAFLGAAHANPTEFLGMQPLLRHKAVPVSEALAFLAEFARTISRQSEGEQVHLKVVP